MLPSVHARLLSPVAGTAGLPDATLADSQPELWEINELAVSDLACAQPQFVIPLPRLDIGWLVLTALAPDVFHPPLPLASIVVPVTPMASRVLPAALAVDAVALASKSLPANVAAALNTVHSDALLASPHGVWAWSSVAEPELVVAFPQLPGRHAGSLGGVATSTAVGAWAAVTVCRVTPPGPLRLDIHPVPRADDALFLATTPGTLYAFNFTSGAWTTLTFPASSGGAVVSALYPARSLPWHSPDSGTVYGIANATAVFRVAAGSITVLPPLPGAVAQVGHPIGRGDEPVALLDSGSVCLWKPSAQRWAVSAAPMPTATWRGLVLSATDPSAAAAWAPDRIAVVLFSAGLNQPPLLVERATSATALFGETIQALLIADDQLLGQGASGAWHVARLSALESPAALLSQVSGVPLVYPLVPPLVGWMSANVSSNGTLAALARQGASSDMTCAAVSATVSVDELSSGNRRRTLLRGGGASLAAFADGDLPEHSPLYLDYGERLTLRLRTMLTEAGAAAVATLGTNASPFAVAISRQDDGDHPRLLVEPTVVERPNATSQMLELQIVVREPGRSAGYPPIQYGSGESLTATHVEVALDVPGVGGGPGCSLSRVGASVDMLVGCAPGLSLQLSESETFSQSEGCRESDPYPCLFFESVFRPVINVVDAVAGTSWPYIGRMYFRVVGGGLTPDSISRFNADEVLDNNLHGSTMWTFDSDGSGASSSDPVISSSANGITFVCSGTSPCADILPNFPDTPEYYMLIAISTVGIPDDTYCGLTTEFVLRVHGIPMNFSTSISFVSASLLAVFIPMVIVYCVKRRAGTLDGDGDGDVHAKRRALVTGARRTTPRPPSRRDLFG
ncbi:uncharacterized protein AMSG_04600 [Thecamonas trahens ATCC 50062]|uniref:CATSPERG C-terminal domain-containing protein n=1 Tax=Thecamonas trahens ATCC 50062 TaxID=461836 RepID=A0A0L0D9D7_THETB|nr:hypothetical protein AMSG_04600 [Thecamonas trahens ATCC 50062]KNC48855.1 hypothetical protein AMSG_04600 [Thecamonas trahens ATCC 50062]|eukprot:XP_013758275.1 hypothetical protein AMSG_04600 [Thecamonas trahens ATCC 50062]